VHPIAMDITRPVTLLGTFKRDVRKYLIDKGFRIQDNLSINGQLLCGEGEPLVNKKHIYYRYATLKKLPIYTEAVCADAGPVSGDLWVDKYRPKTSAEIIGNTEAIKKLREFLGGSGKGPAAVLITGPPGIGKTTAAHLVAREAGYIVHEYNASDVRSESALAAVLNRGGSRSIFGAAKKEVIIMDECDGMTGSDRGGIVALANHIRGLAAATSSPKIICIANDRASPKMRPLVNVCMDIPFTRPHKATITKAVLEIARKERVTGLGPQECSDLCEQVGNDIRSLINRLQIGLGAAADQKEVTLTMFSATQSLFAFEGRTYSLDDANRYVSADYMMVPLMVQDAYIGAARGSLEDVVRAADRISFGDLLETRIGKTQDWSLLPHYMTNTVAVSRTVSGSVGFIGFPTWLAKNSAAMKRRRQMEWFMKGRAGHDVKRLDMVPMVAELLRGEKEAKGFVGRLVDLGVSRDDFVEVVQEIGFDPVDIPTKLKTAITREYNKRVGGTKNVTRMADSDAEADEDALSAEEEASNQE
jgi:replication factor C subunit 1